MMGFDPLKTINIKELKAKKEGEYTVYGVLQEVISDIPKIQDVLVVTLEEDGNINVYTNTSDSTLKFIGLIESGKHILMESFYNS